MTYKQFSQELHDSTDARARNALKVILVDSMWDIVDNPDIHGVDLFLFRNNKHLANIEVEIKTNWRPKDKWSFEDVNFLRRKEKYCKLTEPTLFVIFNRDLSQYLTINSKVIFDCPLEEVKNKFVSNGELFRKVPLDRVIINKIYASVEDVLR